MYVERICVPDGNDCQGKAAWLHYCRGTVCLSVCKSWADEPCVNILMERLWMRSNLSFRCFAYYMSTWSSHAHMWPRIRWFPTGHFCTHVRTLGKLFMHICLCHKGVYGGVQKVRRLTQLTTRYAHHILSLFNIDTCNWDELGPTFLQSSYPVVEELLFLVF